MAAAIRFTVVWLIMAGKLRQIGKETKGARPVEGDTRVRLLKILNVVD